MSKEEDVKPESRFEMHYRIRATELEGYKSQIRQIDEVCRDIDTTCVATVNFLKSNKGKLPASISQRMLAVFEALVNDRINLIGKKQKASTDFWRRAINLK